MLASKRSAGEFSSLAFAESVLAWSHGLQLNTSAWPVVFDPYIEEKCVAAAFDGYEWKLAQTRKQLSCAIHRHSFPREFTAGCTAESLAGVCSAPLSLARNGDLVGFVVKSATHEETSQRCAEHSGVLASDASSLQQVAGQNTTWDTFWLGYVPQFHVSTGWVWQKPDQLLPALAGVPPPGGPDDRLRVARHELLNAQVPAASVVVQQQLAVGFCVSHDSVHHRPDRCPAGWGWLAESDSCVFMYDTEVPQLDAAATCLAQRAELWTPALHADVDQWVAGQGAGLAWTAAARVGSSWQSVYTGKAIISSILAAHPNMDGVVLSVLPNGSALLKGRQADKTARTVCTRPATDQWPYHKFSACPHGWMPLEGHCVRASHTSKLATLHNFADAKRQCGAWGGTLLASPRSTLGMALVAAATWANTKRTDITGVWLGMESFSGTLTVTGFPSQDPCAASTAALWSPACTPAVSTGGAAQLHWDVLTGMNVTIQSPASTAGFACSIANPSDEDIGCPGGWIMTRGTCYKVESTTRYLRDHKLACSEEIDGTYLAALPDVPLWLLLQENLNTIGPISTNIVFGLQRAGMHPAQASARHALPPGTAVASRSLTCAPMRQTWVTSTGERMGRAAWLGSRETGDPPTDAADLSCSGHELSQSGRNADMVAYITHGLPPYELRTADVSALGNTMTVQGLCARKPRSAVLSVPGCDVGWTEVAGKCVRVINDNIVLNVDAHKLVLAHCSDLNTAVFSPRGFLHTSMFVSGLLSFVLDDLVTVGITNRFSPSSLSGRPDSYTTADGFGSAALLWNNNKPSDERKCAALRVSDGGLLEDVRCGDSDGSPQTKSIACEKPMAAPCPTGWQHLRVAGNAGGLRTADRCYKVHTGAVDFATARQNCQTAFPELGSDLMSVDSYWELYHFLGIAKREAGSNWLWVQIDPDNWPLPGAEGTGGLSLSAGQCPLLRYTTSTNHRFELVSFTCATAAAAVCEMSMPGGSFSDTTPPGLLSFPRCGDYGVQLASACASDPWVIPAVSASPHPFQASSAPSSLPTPSVTPVSFSPTPSKSGTPSTSASASSPISASPSPSQTPTPSSSGTVSSTAAARTLAPSSVPSSSAALTQLPSESARATVTGAMTARPTTVQPSTTPTVASSPQSTTSPTATPYAQPLLQEATNTTLLASTSVTLNVPKTLLPSLHFEQQLLDEARSSVLARAFEAALADCAAAWSSALPKTSILGSFWAQEVEAAWWWVVRKAVTVSCTLHACSVHLPLLMQLEARPGQVKTSIAATSAAGALALKLTTLQRKLLTAHMLFTILGEHNATLSSAGRNLQSTSLPERTISVAVAALSNLDPTAILASNYAGQCAVSSSTASSVPAWCSSSSAHVTVTSEGGATTDWTNAQAEDAVGTLESSSNRPLLVSQGSQKQTSSAALSFGAIAGLVAAACVVVVAAAALVWYQRRNRALRSEVQAASAKVSPSSTAPQAPPGPKVLKSAPPAVDDQDSIAPPIVPLACGPCKEDSERKALPAAACNLSTSSGASEHTAVPMSPDGPRRASGGRLLSMPIETRSPAGPSLPFALNMHAEGQLPSSGPVALPFALRQDTTSTAGSSRTRPSVEAMGMAPNSMPFPVEDSFDAASERGSAGKAARSHDFRRMNKFSVRLASEATTSHAEGASTSDTANQNRDALHSLRTTQRYSRFPTRSLLASQRGGPDLSTVRAAQRLGLHDADDDYSSDSSGAGAYVDGQSSRGGASLPEAPFGDALATAQPPGGAAAINAQLPPGVHVSMRYQQRKQQEAAFNAAVGGTSLADTNSTTDLSTEIWTVSHASQVLNTHGRVSPFAPNLSGGNQVELTQLSLGIGSAGIAAASCLTMSTAGSAADKVPTGVDEDSMGPAAPLCETRESPRHRAVVQTADPHSSGGLLAPF